MHCQVFRVVAKNSSDCRTSQQGLVAQRMGWFNGGGGLAELNGWCRAWEAAAANKTIQSVRPRPVRWERFTPGKELALGETPRAHK